MSYTSSIEAMSIHPGMPGSAIRNPSQDGLTAVENIPEMSALNDILGAMNDGLDMDVSELSGIMSSHTSSISDLTSTVDNYTQSALKDLPTNMAILSGGMSAKDHVARVDAALIDPTAPAPHSFTNEAECSEDSILRKGMKALTDAGKYLSALAKSISKAISDLLGPIISWTKDTITAAISAIKNVLQTVGDLISTAAHAINEMIVDAGQALADAFKFLKNKVFLNFMNHSNPCIKGVMDNLIDTNFVDPGAVELASRMA